MDQTVVIGFRGWAEENLFLLCMRAQGLTDDSHKHNAHDLDQAPRQYQENREL